jgi:hypothetical protein
MLGRFAWPAAFVAIAAMTFAHLQAPKVEPSSSEVKVDKPSATVVKEIRALGRLETASLHVEKVIEMKDHQRRLYGLVEADDALLFVASGEVVLGVDLAKLGPEDVREDHGKVHVSLPPIEVLSSRFDEPKSYVHARTTDALARRNEGLESAARKEALGAFEKAGRDPAAVARAQESAEKEIRAIAKAFGATDVVIEWRGPKGEVDLATR